MMINSSTFDASARQTNDSQSRKFADNWFRLNGNDLTDFQGISYGGLLRLPIFLSRQEGRQGSWWCVLSAAISAFWEGLRYAMRSSTLLHPTRAIDQTTVFLMAKCSPNGAIAKTLTPIMEHLEEIGESIAIWTFDENQKTTLQTHYASIPCENLLDVRVSLRDILSLSFMLSRATIRLLLNPSRQSFYTPLVQLFYHAPRFLALQTALKKRLDKKLRIVSATEMHPMERLVFTQARQMHVPTVLIQHGVTNETVKNVLVNTPSIATRLCVWGEAAKRYFISHGTPKKKIDVTGSPALQCVNASTTHQCQKTLPKGSFLLFAGQNFDKEKNVFLAKMVLKAFKIHLQSHLTSRLVITPHPAKSLYTTPTFYQSLVTQLGLNHHVSIWTDIAAIYDLVRASDGLISSSSTLHVEAAMLKTPVILLNIDGVGDMEMVTQGAALGAHTTHECVQALEQITNASTRQKLASNREAFLNDYANVSSDAVQCVINVLNRVSSPL